MFKRSIFINLFYFLWQIKKNLAHLSIWFLYVFCYTLYIFDKRNVFDNIPLARFLLAWFQFSRTHLHEFLLRRFLLPRFHLPDSFIENSLVQFSFARFHFPNFIYTKLKLHLNYVHIHFLMYGSILFWFNFVLGIFFVFMIK